MKNAKTRFAVDDDGSVYDYKTGRNYAPVGFLLETGDAVWDLAKVKELILADQYVDEARTPSPTVTDDKVQAASASFMSNEVLSEPDAVEQPDAEEAGE